ncbi:MAG TPA: hypothetical protein VFL91_06805 [Thermomicrobiales bacterium]|nr:hypothetical protein [Thermomicrobiales bacterium]
MADAEALAERAAGPLLEDEALRGDLTDEGFGPLLDWATNALTAAAERVAAEPDAERRMDDAGAAVKATLQAAVQAAQGHARADTLALLRDPLVARSPLGRARVAAVAYRLGGDADRNATRLAQALKGVRP